MALAGCAPATQDLRLEIEMMATGGARITVTGESGQEVAVSANRAWAGHDEIYVGLLGLRCLPVVTAEDRRLGAGVAVIDRIVDGSMVAELPASKLENLPSPLAIQAVGSRNIGGVVKLTLSNAFLFEKSGVTTTIRPWSTWWRIRRAAGSFLWWIVLPCLLVFAVRRWRAPPRRGLWVLPIALAVVVVARLTIRDGSPGLVPSLPDEPLIALERQYGEGLARIVASSRSAHRPGEAIAILVDETRLAAQQTLAVQLQWLLPDATVHTATNELPARGICILLNATTRKAGEPVEAPTRPGLRGRVIVATPVATLWQLGED